MTFEEERGAALAARRAGRHEDALRHFRAAVALRSADLWSRSDAALELLALRRFAEAELEARLLADAAPDFAPAHRALALTLRAKGDRAGALESFRAAAKADPRDLWNRHDAAVELRDLGRADEAEQAFRRVADGTPLAHALRGLAQAARGSGETERALELFRAASHLLPADPWFALDVAATLRTLGRLSDAQAACTAVLAAHPDFVPALCEEAELLARRGLAEEAETAFARLLVRDPGLVAAYRGLARIAAERGNPETAAAHLKAAAKAKPDDTALHLELGTTLKRAGRWREARRLLQGLASRPETAVPARLELYACIAREEGRGAALSLLEQARDLDPHHPRTLLMLGDDARENGDIERADAWYGAALEARPSFYWALVGKAATARARGDREQAILFLERAAVADPADGHAGIELAALHREAGDFEAARAVLADVPPRSPRAPQAAVAEGLILRAEGRWPEAAAAFMSAARRFPTHVEALVEASEDFLRSGRDEAASQALDEARREGPDRPAVLDALARRALSRDDHEEALLLLGRAIAADPGRLWPRLATARVRAILGDVPGAAGELAACETRFGPRPEIALARIELMRQVGETAAARECLAEARSRFPHHAGLQQQAVLADIEDGRFEDAQAIIAQAAPIRRGGTEAGRLAFLRSLLAAARWEMGEAIEAGETAVARLPADGWVRNRLIHASLIDLDLDRAGRHLEALAELEACASRARGKSANASQSHYGQIHDELRLDPEALETVRQARTLSPERRLGALADAVGAYPDSTAAAIHFFIERQRLGPPARPLAAVAAVPKVIHQYWDDPSPPTDLCRYAASWREANPGFDHRLWNEAEARAFVGQVSPAALTAFERAREPAMKADLFRLALLHEAGGIYADMDDRCVSGIAPLLSGGHSMILYQEDIGSLGNNFMAVEARHPIVARALDLATTAVNRGDTDILWLATGPGLLTRAAAQVLRESPVEADRLLVLDRHDFLRHVAIHCLAGYKATERHWSRTAFGRARKPRGAQAARSRSA